MVQIEKCQNGYIATAHDIPQGQCFNYTDTYVFENIASLIRWVATHFEGELESFVLQGELNGEDTQ